MSQSIEANGEKTPRSGILETKGRASFKNGGNRVSSLRKGEEDQLTWRRNHENESLGGPGRARQEDFRDMLKVEGTLKRSKK